ncbi:MAG TPA: DUF4337 family protein [Acetobacteraceae bacterium]|nr:DUF4337 family protein [Acetobacteraceae bacterium]
MSGDVELAHEGIEHAHHAHEAGDRAARAIAVLVAILAALLAITEMVEKSAESEYLAHHITLSDDWNFEQAKHIRSTVYAAAADLLASLPNAADPAIQARIAAARNTAARLEDDPRGQGRQQLIALARHQTELRDAALHRYHHLELCVSLLQIAIVLASVSVITRVRALAWGGGALGALAAAAAILIVGIG